MGSDTAPAGAIRSPSAKVVPSALTLTEKSSFPASPISARPEKSVWNSRLAVSAGVALFTFIWCPLPAWLNSVADEATDSRLVASAVAFTPSRDTLCGRSPDATQSVPL